MDSTRHTSQSSRATLVGLDARRARRAGGDRVVLRVTYLLYPIGPGGQSDSPTIPACHGRTLAEGFTYKFRNPHRGEIVVFHASGHLGGPITPDPKSHELGISKRVVGLPASLREARERFRRRSGRERAVRLCVRQRCPLRPNRDALVPRGHARQGPVLRSSATTAPSRRTAAISALFRGTRSSAASSSSTGRSRASGASRRGRQGRRSARPPAEEPLRASQYAHLLTVPAEQRVAKVVKA